MSVVKLVTSIFVMMVMGLAHAEQIQVYKNMPSIAVYSDCSKMGDACSVVDKDKMKESKRANWVWQDQMKALAQSADEYYFLANKNAGDYAKQWFLTYVEQGGLLNKVSWITDSRANANEFAQVCWGMTNVAMSYIKIRDKFSVEEQANIESWMKKIVDKVAYSRYRFGSDDYNKVLNNHYFSRALPLMAVGVATNDKRMINDAKFVIKVAMGEINAEGIWPLEVKRKEKSLHYQSFTLTIVKIAIYVGSINDPEWANTVIADPRIKLAENASIRLFTDTEYHRKVTGGYAPDRNQSGRCGSWAYPYIQLSTDAEFRNAVPSEIKFFYDGCGFSYMVGGNPDQMRDDFYKIK